MADALFYTPAQVKEKTPLSKNIDDNYLTQVILLCQDLYIEPILGTTLYEEIKTAVIGSTLAGVNKTLVDDYIRPALKWYVASEAVDEVSSPVTNKGVVKRDGEASTAADKRVVDQKASKYLDWAESYADTLVKYLCENDSDYPSYQNPDNGLHIKRPRKDSYTTSLFLGRVRKGYDSLKDKYGDS